MKEFWWKLPGLRSLTPLRRGLVESLFVLLIGALLIFPLIWLHWGSPPDETFGDLSQIGATLLVAYAVETSWWLKVAHRHTRERENWVGAVVGIGFAGVVGIACALVLSTHSGSLNWLQGLAYTWCLLTSLLLGSLVAVLPLLIYEWTRELPPHPPDE